MTLSTRLSTFTNRHPKLLTAITYLALGSYAGRQVDLLIPPKVAHEIHVEKMANAYYCDVNNDGKQDIVVRSESGAKIIFLQNKDTGKYELLEDVLKTERGLYETRIEGMTRSVDDKIKSFEAEHMVK